MSEEQLRDLALEMLSNLRSWIEHSDAYRPAIFPYEEGMNDESALQVIAWMEKQIEKPEQGA